MATSRLHRTKVQLSEREKIPLIFKASALWADAFYKSKCPYVCLSVCPSRFLTPFNVFFFSLFQSPMSKLLKFSESLGKSNGKE